MENGENEEKHKVNPVMETVLLCLHGLSRSNMSNEEKIQVCRKVFESFSSSSKENQEEINTNEVQAWQRDESLLHEDKGHEKSSQNEVEKVSNEDPTAEKVSKENIISMLFKAVKDGVLQLKDVQTTIQGLLTRSHEGDVEIRKMGNKFIHAMNDSNFLPFGAEMVTEERKGEDSLKGDEIHQGPSVLNQAAINRIAVSKSATATRQREPCPSTGSPCNKLVNHVNQQKQINLSPFPADGHAALVPNVNLAQATFSEIVKQGTKGNSHVSQQPPSEVKDKSSLPSFSDMIQLGLNAFNLEKTPTMPSNSISQKKEKLPVTCPQSPISFLEAAKRCMNNSPSPDSQNKNFSSSLLMRIEDSDMAKDGGSRVVVPTETLRRRMEFCKLSVIGRVVLAKGDEPWNSKKLRERLKEVWNFNSSWRLISLGKGFFHVLLTSQEEFEKVWMRGAVNLKPGVMRFQKWSFGFDPTKEKSTNAQVWFRFYNLPWCLWESSILTALSKKIGTPIRFDNNTINGDFGHYARVLVDVDLSKNIKEVLQLDCGNDVFDVKVVPENPPNFCNACSNIGHNSSECRMTRKKVENAKVTNDCNITKAEVAIQNRLEVHRNKGKGISHGSSSSRQEEMGGTFESQTIHESAKENHKNKGMEEMVPDIGNQALSVSLPQGSKDIHTSNKFAALEEHEDKETGNEDKRIQNSGMDEANCEDKLKGIRMWAEKEKRNIMQQAEDSGQIVEKGVDESPTPKTPKRWSDIQEEEEENEAQEASSKPYFPKPTDVLSFERNGELVEIFMKNGKLRFTPTSDKSKN